MSQTRHRLSIIALCAALLTAPGAGFAQTSPQSHLKPVLNTGGTPISFDWPMLRIGTGEYSEGPTGVTVIRFGRKVLGAVDVRGGAPGTVNAAWLDLMYNVPEVDAVVFSGGSWYGLESVTAVSTAIKDDGQQTGSWNSIALSVGSIVYDFGARRLNEIYPDKALAQAAYRAAETGVFRNGAAGAGRMTRSGEFFGCNAHAGQGAAFHQVGELKIAAFTVVNAYGAVVDRNGKLAACYRHPDWPADVTPEQLLQNLPESRKVGWGADKANARNTTVSLIVVNQKMDPAELKRLGVQVHTSMSRGLQPFASMNDGDVLYAISTDEFDPAEPMSSPELGAIASEVMWDAILNSVPEQPPLPVVASAPQVTEKALKAHAGDYRFSGFVSVRVTAEGGKLYAQATGERAAFAIGKDARTELLPYREGVFMVPGRYPLVLDFTTRNQLIINPGQWQQKGERQ